MSGLALNEKVRTVALLLPELLLTGKSEELIGKFEEKYLEVKARKQVYLNATDANAFFQFIPSAEKRAAVVESATRGLSEVVVIEHLDGEAIERTKALVEQMEMTELSSAAPAPGRARTTSSSSSRTLTPPRSSARSL